MSPLEDGFSVFVSLVEDDFFFHRDTVDGCVVNLLSCHHTMTSLLCIRVAAWWRCSDALPSVYDAIISIVDA